MCVKYIGGGGGAWKGGGGGGEYNLLGGEVLAN